MAKNTVATSAADDDRVEIPIKFRRSVIDAICDWQQYKEKVPDKNDPIRTVPNPVSKEKFFRRFVRDQVNRLVVQRRTELAMQQLNSSLEESAKRELTDDDDDD